MQHRQTDSPKREQRQARRDDERDTAIEREKEDDARQAQQNSKNQK